MCQTVFLIPVQGQLCQISHLICVRALDTDVCVYTAISVMVVSHSQMYDPSAKSIMRIRYFMG
jgi:hypothetical protein